MRKTVHDWKCEMAQIERALKQDMEMTIYEWSEILDTNDPCQCYKRSHDSDTQVSPREFKIGFYNFARQAVLQAREPIEWSRIQALTADWHMGEKDSGARVIAVDFRNRCRLPD